MAYNRNFINGSFVCNDPSQGRDKHLHCDEGHGRGIHILTFYFHLLSKLEVCSFFCHITTMYTMQSKSHVFLFISKTIYSIKYFSILALFVLQLCWYGFSGNPIIMSQHLSLLELITTVTIYLNSYSSTNSMRNLKSCLCIFTARHKHSTNNG